MANENETIADIVAEMRNFGELDEKSTDKIPRSLMGLGLRTYADRIKAAANREREPKPLTIPEWIDHEESIADIAAVLRRYVLPSLADRLEAAWNREKLANAPRFDYAVLNVKEQPVGNAAAMRETLESVRNWCYNKLNNTSYQVTVEGLLSIVNAALSAPPRNCDVGTADEQYARWRRFCDSQKHCNQCPVYKLANVCESKTRCNLIWAQMPYEEGGRDA